MRKISHSAGALAAVLVLAGTACRGAVPPTLQPAQAGEVAELLGDLKSGDEATQSRAARRLGKMILSGAVAKDDAQVRDGLRNLLLAGRNEASSDARFALVQLGPSVFPVLMEALRAEAPAARSYGAQAIWSLARSHPERRDEFAAAIPVLADLLQDERVRDSAVGALLMLGPPAGKPLIAVLEVPRLVQPELLAELGPSLVPDLLKALAAKSPVARSGAARTLGHMKGSPPEVIEPLAELLKDEDGRVRLAAVEALRDCGTAARPAIDRLLAVADAGSVDTQSVWYAIGTIGPEPRHVEALFDRAFRTRRAGETNDTWREIARALGHVDPPPVAALVGALRDPREEVRVTAAWALAELGPKGRDAVPALIGALEDASLREPAAWALSRMGSAARQAVPALVAMLKEGEWADGAGGPIYRSPSVGALAAMGPSVIPELVKGLAADDASTQAGCRLALEELLFKEPATSLTVVLLRLRAPLSLRAREALVELLVSASLDRGELVARLRQLEAEGGAAGSQAEYMRLRIEVKAATRPRPEAPVAPGK